MKKCPSCGNNVDAAQMCCPTCGWQFASPTLCATRAGTIVRSGQTLARGVTRPNWICSAACQLAVLVRDRSGSMKGHKAKDASPARLDLVRALADPSCKDGFYCGVVDFSTTADVVHPATRATELISHMAALNPGLLAGCTNITDGLAKANEIVANFTPLDSRKQLKPLILLFSDGGHNEGPKPDSVAALTKANADLICIAFGDGADEEDLRAWASPNLFTRCSSGADLRRFFAVVGATLQATQQRGVNATQALASLNVS